MSSFACKTVRRNYNIHRCHILPYYEWVASEASLPLVLVNMDIVVKMDRFQILHNVLKVKYTLVDTLELKGRKYRGTGVYIRIASSIKPRKSMSSAVLPKSSTFFTFRPTD